jgi:glycerol-3-phosphate dehydrogenase
MTRTISPKQHYDLIIIGGGIYGSVLLWEAINRGYNAVLVESGDFCSGTTANTAKILHGGIRYLQSLNLRRIKESSHDRQHYCKLAPHLTSPLPSLMPTDRSLSRNRWIMGAGFYVYNLLLRIFTQGEVDPVFLKNGLISQAEMIDRVRWLDPKRVTGAAQWTDAQVNNAERLGFSFVKTAMDAGADAFNYLRVKEILSKRGAVTGVVAVDRLSNKTVALSGDLVVTTTGHWSRHLLSPLCPSIPSTHHFQRAVNLIVPLSLSSYALGLKVKKPSGPPERRLLFASPWQGQTLFGTWYFKDLLPPAEDRGRVTADEINHCLDEINLTFGNLELTADDCSLIHVGHLPVDSKERLMEKEEIIDPHRHGGPTGLYAVQGVKYTTALSVAKKTFQLLEKRTLSQRPITHRATTSLYGWESDQSDLDPISTLKEPIRAKLSPMTLERLARNYGTVMKRIVEWGIRQPSLLEPLPGTDNTLCAEIPYLLENEAVYRLSDLLVRRMGLGGEGRPNTDTIAFCASQMSSYLGWTLDQEKREISSLIGHYNR